LRKLYSAAREQIASGKGEHVGAPAREQRSSMITNTARLRSFARGAAYADWRKEMSTFPSPTDPAHSLSRANPHGQNAKTAIANRR